jgi:hypothetical protein
MQKEPLRDVPLERLVASYQEGYGLPRAFYLDTALYEHRNRAQVAPVIHAGEECALPCLGPGWMGLAMISI